MRADTDPTFEAGLPFADYPTPTTYDKNPAKHCFAATSLSRLELGALTTLAGNRATCLTQGVQISSKPRLSYFTDINEI
jgi:hypothetical protein